jgi:surface polysaccharide O-acyltransferase-like enzyme
VYFLFGYALGADGPGALRGWMASDGRLAKGWRLWQAVAGVVFVAFVAALIAWLVGAGQGKPQPVVGFAATALFALTGAATTLALLAGFARWERHVERVVTFLSPHAFGIYLVHYVFVTWLQYLLLPVEVPGLVKAGVVSVGAVAASLGLTALFRRIPGLTRVL